MFKFNFSITNEANEVNKEIENLPEPSTTDFLLECKPLKTHLVTGEHLHNFENLNFHCTKERLWKNHLKLQYFNSDGLNHLNSDAGLPSQEHSDLIPAVYEGGFKIWECTWDLLEHLSEQKITFDNKRVLDLGCGSGILGIAAYFDDAKHVVFQDYNKEVIEEWTIPNVILNLESKRDSEDNFSSLLNFKFTFYSGDWNDFYRDSDLEEEKFDFILTSETIYNTSNYGKLITVFERCLKPSGVMYPFDIYIFYLFSPRCGFLRMMGRLPEIKARKNVTNRKITRPITFFIYNESLTNNFLYLQRKLFQTKLL